MLTLTVWVALVGAISAQSLSSAASSAASSVTSSAALTSASSSTNTTGTSSGPVTHTVAVAKGGHSFSPDVTLAEVGDTIEFQFYPTNHSVIRADYGYPCVPYEMILGAGHEGFWSGWEPVDAVLDDPPQWSVVVNDTDPIFFYCGAPGSCISYGMVGVINPNASTSLEKQRQLAEASTFVLVPGEDWPSEGSIPSGVATSSTSTPTATGSAATVTAIPAHSHGLGAGAIAGIAIGGAAVLLAAAVAIWFCGRQSRKQQPIAPGAPAQEIQHGYNPATASMYGKPSHMSTVSGWTMPPGYEHQGMHPQGVHTPVDPMMGQQGPVMYPGSPSPNLHSASPVYAPSNMYAVGTHNVAPAEMEGGTSVGADNRRSTDKQGVERYS